MTSGPPLPLVARAAAWYRALGASRRVAVVALLVANAIPIVGVLFLGWSLMTVLVLYWLENGIVGLWNIPRIVLAQGSESVAPGGSGWSSVPAAHGPRPGPTAPSSGPVTDPATAAAPGSPAAAIGCNAFVIVPFFVVHYGLFWLGHGFFLSFLPAFASVSEGGVVDPSVVPPGVETPFDVIGIGDPFGGTTAFGLIDEASLFLAAAALVVSHGISFFVNFIGRREYLRAAPQRQMMAVYGRVVVLHLTILFGAFAAAILGSPIWILLILVVGKTILDLGLHAREHGPVPPA